MPERFQSRPVAAVTRAVALVLLAVAAFVPGEAGGPGQDDVIGYVLASEVELVGVGPGVEPPVGSVPATGPGPVIGIPGLQEQYDQGRCRDRGPSHHRRRVS